MDAAEANGERCGVVGAGAECDFMSGGVVGLGRWEVRVGRWGNIPYGLKGKKSTSHIGATLERQSVGRRAAAQKIHGGKTTVSQR